MELLLIAVGGVTPPGARVAETELWNGTNWTEVNDLNQAREKLTATGTYTSAVAFMGDVPPQTGATETWNGTNWTTSTNMNVARENGGGAGTQTAALAFAGSIPPTTGVTEEFVGAGVQTTVTFTDS